MDQSPTPPVSLPGIAATVLDDLQFYLSRIDPVTYQASLELLSGSTIGQHTRHIIEFFICLMEQSTESETPVISYERRRRDFLIESAPDHALQKVMQICAQLKELDTTKSCWLDCEEHGEENLQVLSTIGRELVYTVEHTIHHLAIVKIALKAAIPSISLPEHFGVAPSTIRYRQQLCAQ
ncbi:MAG TPA: hypothetical protein VGK46_09265 [Saprospiraceae bacterium]